MPICCHTLTHDITLAYIVKGALYELKTFFNYKDTFWCQDEVIAAIDDGTFKDKYHKWVSDDDETSGMKGEGEKEQRVSCWCDEHR